MSNKQLLTSGDVQGWTGHRDNRFPKDIRWSNAQESMGPKVQGIGLCVYDVRGACSGVGMTYGPVMLASTLSATPTGQAQTDTISEFGRWLSAEAQEAIDALLFYVQSFVASKIGTVFEQHTPNHWTAILKYDLQITLNNHAPAQGQPSHGDNDEPEYNFYNHFWDTLFDPNLSFNNFPDQQEFHMPLPRWMKDAPDGGVSLID
ncbi:hypothetical protein DEU56DRAFT_761424 [Suillus clintonianus]|uniref:uncharacterized protein n=1 Tax=Suillus clintonianus TaxID=1904413 RepID=UPI001B86C624|nr:uncharacterized protein DEU56DRAFT_761424 [Suillus clintonianus]KAG2116971.1 hypothetical protein DEU56DRAFT_761424 [Suillus clintonianus]